MPAPDLSKLTMEELQSTITEAQKLLAVKAEAKRSELLAELAKLDGLTGKTPEAKPSRQRAAPKPLYRTPDGKSFRSISEPSTSFGV